MVVPNGIAEEEDGFASPQQKEEKGDEVIRTWKSTYLCCQGEE